MHFPTIVLINLIVPLIVSFSLIIAKKEKVKENRVVLSKTILVIGLICMLAFLIPAVIISFSYKSIGAFVALSCFSALGGIMVLGYINCRIWYDDEGFIVKNILGIKRKYSYHDISGIKYNEHETYLYTEKRRVLIDEFALGNLSFISFAQKKYNEIFGEAIPRVSKKSKGDIFNGNIYNPTQFIVVYAIMYGAILAFTVFLCWGIFFSPTNDSTQVQTSFESCYIDDGDLVLKSVDSDVYRVLYIPDDYNNEAIQTVCRSGAKITLEVEYITPKDNEPYYEVISISDGDNIILSKDETRVFKRNGSLPIFIVPAVFFAFWTIHVVLSVIVGRNPQKYKKYVKWFFRPKHLA